MMESPKSNWMNPPPADQASAAVGALVCVVDDEETVRRSLSRLLRSAGHTARTFASARDFLDSEPHPGPCCLILDVNMPELDGFDLQVELAGRTEQIVFLTGYGDVPMCARAMKSGAVDFLSKPVGDVVLLDAVSRALDRSAAMGSAVAGRKVAQSRLSRLTPRERAVFDRVVTGLMNKQIAADLGIAEKTIKVHRGRMMRKTGVLSVPDLVRLAIAAGCSPLAATGETPT
jgi:FixJ family two-component response regulator